MANEIFISYSRKDYDKVRLIKREIDQAVGIDCWMDMDGIESGDYFKKVIISAINRHDTVLFMLTPHSMDSPFAMKELSFAARKGKRVILVDLANTEMNDDFLFDYSDKDNINWNDPLQHDKLIKNLRIWFSPTLKQDEPSRVSKAERFLLTRPILPLYFIVDCSREMSQQRLDIVNSVCSQAIKEFEVRHPMLSEAEIRVNVLQNGQRSEWMWPSPSKIDDFIWKPLTTNYGISKGLPIAEAYDMLRIELERLREPSSDARYMAPVMIFISGEANGSNGPQDKFRLDLAREGIKRDPLFKAGNKWCIDMGNGYGNEELSKIASSSEAILNCPYDDGGATLLDSLEMIMRHGLVTHSNMDEEFD